MFSADKRYNYRDKEREWEKKSSIIFSKNVWCDIFENIKGSGGAKKTVMETMI